MQSALSQAFSEPLLAAMPQLSEKPHLGVPSSNPALYLGHEVCNSTTALGLRAALHLERVRSRSTGKERDAESGNDYFGARYYASSMGRFMSPDWSAKAEPVPYAKLADPQSLNLYVYVLNNPMTGIDKDGHCASGSWWCDAWHGATQVVSYAASTLYGKAQVGVGLGGEVKLGPAKVKVEAKDVTETRTAKDDSSRKEVTEVKASVKVGPVEVGLGITGEKPLQDANGNAPADAKTEWTPLLGFDYKSLSTDSHGWDVGVGAGGCVVLCLGAEGGVNAGKVVSDATTLLKQSVDAMQTLTGPTY